MARAVIMLIASTVMAASMVAPAWAKDQQCRKFTDEIRVGDNDVDSYGIICQQPDGTWREVQAENKKYEKGGYFIRPNDSRNYQPAQNTRIYDLDDMNTQVVIGKGRQPYVVVDPFRNYRYSPRDYRNWSPAKRSFYQHHHGPNWEKHWEHHKRAMGD
ncbi:MAG: hypothetical protein MK052_10505 [Alphaproteobacteria bacterium]|nr:hypothetical protein [Alphaproteobacteria bacterium]